MKRAFFLAVILCVTGFIAYRLLFVHAPAPEEKKDLPLAIDQGSGTFNAGFARMLSDYYSVKDALVDWDTAAADRAAGRLTASADSVHFRQLKADSAVILTAGQLVSSIASEAQALIGEDSIEGKRRSFNAMTDELYNLVRTVRYNGQVIYYIRCPMAFGDSAEAYWLSNTSKIVNPYLGRKHPKYHDKELGCGELVDSLQFAQH